MRKVKVDSFGVAKVNAINELTPDSGVKVEGVLFKDNTQTGVRVPIINVTGTATVNLDILQSGSTVVLSKASGFDVVLPNPEVGAFFDFIVITSISSNTGVVRSRVTTQVWTGSVVSFDFDTLDKETQWAPDGTDYAISMNGGALCGKAGTAFRLTCIAADKWNITGALVGDAVPFTSPFI